MNVCLNESYILPLFSRTTERMLSGAVNGRKGRFSMGSLVDTLIDACRTG